MVEGQRLHGLDQRKNKASSTHKHQFESFNQRVSKINIDPIRRVRQQDAGQEASSTQSYFKDAFLHWRDTNLSENFTRFVRDVEPYCDSLPQIIYHRSKIIELLHQYLEERQSLSLEPLLSLQAHLAHDLGTKFEEHFPSTLTLILSIAAKHQDVEVIEWSFTCLAWLFKYLSRLLIPNLKPTYDIMASTLGKENHKSFIARFAAESMSFLIRKAAAAYHKHHAYLESIVNRVLSDIAAFQQSSENAEVFLYGVMTLFATSIHGVDRALHSSGLTIYQCLLKSAPTSGGFDVIHGVTTSLIHYTDERSFTPILESVCSYIEQMDANVTLSEARLYEGLLFIMVAVRKGSRVRKWQTVLSAIKHLLEIDGNGQNSFQNEDLFSLWKTAALTLQTAPIDVIISNLGVLEMLMKKISRTGFLAFCDSFSNLHSERFARFVRSYYYRFVALQWNDLEDALLVSTHSIRLHGALNTEGAKKSSSLCPKPWAERIISAFEKQSLTPQDAPRLQGYLDLLGLVDSKAFVKSRVLACLREWIEIFLGGDIVVNDYTKLLLGGGFRLVLASVGKATTIEWSSMCKAAPSFGSMPLYIKNLLSLSNQREINYNEDSLDGLATILIRNLSSQSKALRRASLELLSFLVDKRHKPESDIFQTALAIENLPLEVQSARTASMYARQLSESYKRLSTIPWIASAIPHFCFGLLHFRLAPLWDDAINVLRSAMSCPRGEESITEIVFSWLEASPLSSPQSPSPKETFKKQKLNEFQCTNLIQIDQVLMAGYKNVTHATDRLQERFRSLHEMGDPYAPNCRAQAIRVLKGIPELAEKRSRRLVPLFLGSLSSEESLRAPAEVAEEDGEQAPLQPGQHRSTLPRSDIRALLDVFASFSNPRVIYRASEMYNVLLQFLSNGDAQIQKAALKALTRWKPKKIEQYQENLFNLLDEARFREELAVFVRADDDRDLFASKEIQNDILPLLLRLLYGRIIARQGATSGKNSLISKRRAVFDALSGLSDDVVGEFVALALGPLHRLDVTDGEIQLKQGLKAGSPSQRQQLGLLNLVKDMLDVMGNRLTFCLSPLVEAILFCSGPNSQTQEMPHTEVNTASSFEATSKALKRASIQCLLLVFKRFSPSKLEAYLSMVFKNLINPRLQNFANESGQSVSGMLQLFAVWASSPNMALYLDFDQRILPSLVSVLTISSAKDDVKIFILDQILKPLALLASTKGEQIDFRSTLNRLVQLNAEMLLEGLTLLLKETSTSKQVLENALELVALLSRSFQASPGVLQGSIQGGSGVLQALLDLYIYLLLQPSQRVSPKSKGDILEGLLYFIPASHPPAKLLDSLYESVVPQFGFFRDRESRCKTADTLKVLAEFDASLDKVASLCQDLNSFSNDAVDSLDLPRRFQAYQTIDSVAQTLSARQWAPILHNMLFYIKDVEELAFRTSASHCLRQFIKTSCQNDSSNRSSFDAMRGKILSEVRDGMSNPSELVRAEYLTVLAELVRCNLEWDEIKDLKSLLMNNDEEASFFTNILHIQQHRRLRALRRLASEGRRGTFQSRNIAHLIFPLIEHFVTSQVADSNAHNLVTESVTTFGTLAEHLEWPQFRAVFRRYTGYLQSKPEFEKQIIRLLSSFAEVMNKAAATSSEQSKELGQVSQADETSSKFATSLSRTMPRQEKLTESIYTNLIEPLQSYVHHKDETVVSQRMPVAIVVVKLLKLLSAQAFSESLSPLLTDVCHVLRSRSQESRDLTRRTLADILQFIGPKHLNFILKELRSALPRGYQLHILSYTVHSILLSNESLLSPGDLDPCLSILVNIIMDDIFGATGQEKDAEDYISKMKEVRGNKSFDSMEIVAKVVSLNQVKHLIAPLRTFLEERLDLRMLKKVDELFRRLGLGLFHNGRVASREGLVLCYELLRQASSPSSGKQPEQEDQSAWRFEIQVRPPRKDLNSQHTTSCIYKLARFSLDLLRSIMVKFENLRTASNLSGFMPLIGEALINAHEEVQNSAMRLLAAIIKTPLKEIDLGVPVYIFESMKVIKGAATASSESAQAALKLVTVVLRERPGVEIREADLAYLLQKVGNDIEEPDRQGVTFNFLKAVLQRKVLIPEVYEILDSISAMMITNQSQGARNTARGLYVQFFINYPQTRNRLKKQLAFLVKNLTYQHVEGRQSIMETLHQLLMKGGEEFVQDLVGFFFAPLVLVMVNDDSADCRRMAGTLIRTIFGRANDERLSHALALLRGWINQDKQLLLVRAALQIYGIYLDLFSVKGEKELPLLKSRLKYLLENSQSQDLSDAWETTYFSLQLMDKLCEIYPETMFQAENANLWDLVKFSYSFPHGWVKLASSKLLGNYFADVARMIDGVQDDVVATPLYGSRGLQLTFNDMLKISQESFRSLRVKDISEELAAQLVKNLVFLGRLFASLEQPEDLEHDVEESASVDEWQPQRQDPLGHVFSQVSALLRRDPSTKAHALVPQNAAIQILAALSSYIPITLVSRYLPRILQPLYYLTDSTVTAPSSSEGGFKARYDALVSKAHEIISLLQTKVGTSDFVGVMAEIRKSVEEKRKDRRIKRRIEAVADPESAGVKRNKKHIKEKLRRKERNSEQRSRRRGW